MEWNYKRKEVGCKLWHPLSMYVARDGAKSLLDVHLTTP